LAPVIELLVELLCLPNSSFRAVFGAEKIINETHRPGLPSTKTDHWLDINFTTPELVCNTTTRLLLAEVVSISQTSSFSVSGAADLAVY